MIDKSAKIYVAGHHGLVGSAIWNNLLQRGYANLVGRSHRELDLLDAVAVRQFFDTEQPEAVVLAAAHVGGIMANLQYRADFIYQNLQIQQNVIGESFRHGVQKCKSSRTSSARVSATACRNCSSWAAPASTRVRLPSP